MDSFAPAEMLEELKGKKLGIALGGGGAKGLAHIGVLKAFAEAGIHFDIVTGTSIGAIVGSIYASGKLADLEETVLKVKKKRNLLAFLGPSWTMRGIFSGSDAIQLVKQHVSVEKLEDLPKKFGAVSVDLNTGEMVNRTSGNLLAAVKASFAIPGVFPPISYKDRVLVDGGVIDPVPIEAARQLGAEYVVGVDLFGELPALQIGHDSKGPKINVLDVVDRTLSINQRALLKGRLADHPADLLLQPKVFDIGVHEFYRGSECIRRGVEAVK